MTCAPTKVLSVPVTVEVSALGSTCISAITKALADVRAALLLDDLDELGLEAAVRGGIGELQCSSIQ